VKASQGFGQVFVIAGQAAKTGQPSEAAFNHSTTGEKNKALPGIGQLDHLQANAMLGGLCRWVVSGVAAERAVPNQICAKLK